MIEDAGVDIVHGHSSHHVKAIEVHRERLILYGCGDLITDYEGISGKEAFRSDLGLMYFPRLDPDSGRLLALQMRATRMRKMQLARPGDEGLAWLQETLNREGRQFGTAVRPRDEGTFDLQWDK